MQHFTTAETIGVTVIVLAVLCLIAWIAWLTRRDTGSDKQPLPSPIDYDKIFGGTETKRHEWATSSTTVTITTPLGTKSMTVTTGGDGIPKVTTTTTPTKAPTETKPVPPKDN